MKLLKELVRIFTIIGVSFGLWNNEPKKALSFIALMLFVVYIYPIIMTFFAKLLGIKKSRIGYDGEICIRLPKNETEGKIKFKMYKSPEDIYLKDEMLFMVQRGE